MCHKIECESFTIISIDSLLTYEQKYYLQVYFHNCVYKIVDKEMTDYLDDNVFETNEDQFSDFDKWVLQILHYDGIDLSERIKLIELLRVISKRIYCLPLLAF